MRLQQAPFLDRNNLGNFLNTLGLTGLGVEIGTHRADYASHLLSTWEGSTLYCVDPWTNLPGYEYQATLLWGNGDREEDRVLAYERLSAFAERAVPIESTSLQIVGSFKDNSLDFVYIDGDHQKEAVTADLAAWYPKLKSGGIIAGHDIVCPGETPESDWGCQIQPAVFSFSTLHDLTVFLIVESQALPWSYYMVKQ